LCDLIKYASVLYGNGKRKHESPRKKAQDGANRNFHASPVE